MSERVLAFGAGTLFVMAAAWMLVLRRMRTALRERHPETYDELGMERIFRRYNMGPVVALLQFLWRREYLDLHDPQLEGLGTFMRGLLVAYVPIFAFVLVGAFIHLNEQQAMAEGAAMELSEAPEESAQLRAAFDLHRARRYAEALAIYDEIEQAGGGTAEVSYWRGLANWHLRRTEEALADFRAVIALEPGNLQAHRHADRILAGQKRWDEILQLWHAYLAVVPRDAEGYFERGGTYYRKGDVASAREDAAKACELGKKEGCDWARRLEQR